MLKFRENLLLSPSGYNNEEVTQLVHITLQHCTLFFYFILNHSKYINMVLCILKGAKYQFSTDVVYTYVVNWSITLLIYHFLYMFKHSRGNMARLNLVCLRILLS